MRILVLAPTPYFSDRGCHVRIYEEARELIRRGHDVRIVTYHLGRDLPGIPTFRIPSMPWYRKLAAGPSWHKPYLDILLFLKALGVARKFKPHVIHAHLHEGAFLGVFLKRLLKLPLLFDCQGSLTGEIVDHGFVGEGSLLFRLFLGIEGFVNRGADRIITSSGPGADDLRDRWRMPGDKVRVLTDGVDTVEFSPRPGAEARERLGIPPDVPVGVFLGVMNTYQGLDILLDVASCLSDRGTAIHFLVMGFPEEEYQRRAAERGLGGRMTFTGRIDYGDAAAFLSAGDVALSPKVSLTEANGKLFNYMACGLPVVAFDTPVNREILGEAGAYARFGDAMDFADRLEELIVNRGKRSELAERGREKAVREHAWQARGAELETVCRELAG